LARGDTALVAPVFPVTFLDAFSLGFFLVFLGIRLPFVAFGPSNWPCLTLRQEGACRDRLLGIYQPWDLTALGYTDAGFVMPAVGRDI
jgi:hypothetical protein